MSKVWIKTQKQFETCIFEDGVFGDIEAVKQDKMQYYEQAKKYVKQRIDEITTGRNRFYVGKTNLIIELEERKEELSHKNQRDTSLEVLISGLEQQIDNYSKSIKDIEEELVKYMNAFSNPFTTIDIYLEECSYIFYTEYTLRFS